MQTVTLNLYNIYELDDKAKERARDWWRSAGELFWCDESRESIQEFCNRFGASLDDWSVGPFAPIYYKVSAEQRNFRGVRLSTFPRDFMPTGYCLDCTLWETFHDEFKRTGSAKLGFEAAIDAGFKAWRDDMESQHEDDYIDEHLAGNDYHFTADGRFYR